MLAPPATWCPRGGGMVTVRAGGVPPVGPIHVSGQSGAHAAAARSSGTVRPPGGALGRRSPAPGARVRPKPGLTAATPSRAAWVCLMSRPLLAGVRYPLMMMLPMRVSLTPSSHDFLGGREPARPREWRGRPPVASAVIGGGGWSGWLR